MKNPLWHDNDAPNTTCENCAWRYVGGRGHPVSRCRRHNDARIAPTSKACPAFTAPLNCLACAACCRHAFDTVEVSQRDPFTKAHPEYLVTIFGRLNVRRKGPNCAALNCSDYTCAVYEERPRTCRELKVGSDNCLLARQRIGLTP
jgi:hypothetical protein